MEILVVFWILETRILAMRGVGHTQSPCAVERVEPNRAINNGDDDDGIGADDE